VYTNYSKRNSNIFFPINSRWNVRRRLEKWNFLKRCAYKRARSQKAHPLRVKFGNPVLQLTFSAMPYGISMKKKLSFAFNLFYARALYRFCIYIELNAYTRLHTFFSMTWSVVNTSYNWFKEGSHSPFVGIQIARVRLHPLVSRKSWYSREPPCAWHANEDLHRKLPLVCY